MFFEAEKLAEWSGGVWDAPAPGSICGVSNNTRTIKPDELYVAIRGENFDGHAFVLDAFSKGACGAMVDASFALDEVAAGPLLRVDDTLAALGKIASGYRQEVDPVIVGITGSVGKTSVKEMLASILAEAMPTAKTLGNYNNEIGLPLSLLSMESDSKAGVFEVGMNHPGEVEPLAKLLQPQWGVVTAIGPVHIEYFDSVEDIAREKGALLKSLPADGHAVLCSDDPYFDILRSYVDCALHTVSLEKPADYVVNYSAGSELLSVYESDASTDIKFNWKWPGEHNALNAGYAVAVARGMLISWDCITTGLANYCPLSMRWDVENVNGIQIINDAYNANPLSMRAALRTFEEAPISGNKWLVLGAMKELGSSSNDEHVSLGKYVANRKWDGVIVVGEDGEVIASGMKRSGFDTEKTWCCANNAEAVDVLHRDLKVGDGVLLKASRSVALEEVVEGLKKTYKEKL